MSQAFKAPESVSLHVSASGWRHSRSRLSKAGWGREQEAMCDCLAAIQCVFASQRHAKQSRVQLSATQSCRAHLCTLPVVCALCLIVSYLQVTMSRLDVTWDTEPAMSLTKTGRAVVWPQAFAGPVSRRRRGGTYSNQAYNARAQVAASRMHI